MSFVEFLMENYVLIISIIIILVVGVIGFIVDANQKENNNENIITNNKDEKKLENNEPIELEPQKIGTKISPQPTVDFQNSNQTNNIQQVLQSEPLVTEPVAPVVQPQPYNPSVVTTNGAQPFDISSMFANNK